MGSMNILFSLEFESPEVIYGFGSFRKLQKLSLKNIPHISKALKENREN
jgi:hypothetical protein